MVDILPVVTLGLSRPHTISIEFGIRMLSFERVNLSKLAAIAAPPPLLDI